MNTSTKTPTLHLCDFDGTLTRADSLLRFVVFALPPWHLAVAAFVVPFQFLRLILQGKWSNEAGKEALLSQLFKHQTAHALETLGERFCLEKLPTLLRHDLLEQLRSARQSGNTVAIVSASPDLWLRPFCRAEGFDLICTELEFAADKQAAELRFTGRLATPNCNGKEKARRVRAAYALSGFSKIMAYGNSAGDAALFELADEAIKF